MSSTREICGTKATPGSRNRGILWVGPYFYPPCNRKIRKYVRIPFNVIRGTVDGPTLCITAGVHPTEYVNIAAAIRLSNETNFNELRGTVIIVPVVNILGFEQREYVCPVDGLNLQGHWPGKTEYEGGTISHMILNRVFGELVSKANYYLDLHGSDVHETMLPSASYYRTGKKALDEKSEGMARATGVKYISYMEGEEGKGSSQRVMAEKGIPSALFECAEGDKMLPEEVEYSLEAIRDVLRYLKMIEGRTGTTEGQMVTVSTGVRVNHDGLFYSEVKLGDSILEDQILGEVKDLFGEVVETVRAPSKGVVTFLMHNPKVEVGQTIISLRRPRAETSP